MAKKKIKCKKCKGSFTQEGLCYCPDSYNRIEVRDDGTN